MLRPSLIHSLLFFYPLDGYSGEASCADLSDKPQACLQGSADAQNAVAMEQLIGNGITFLTSSLVGSLSDEYGRKGIMMLGIFLSLFSPLTLVWIQMNASVSPNWYYAAGIITGFVNWITVALSSLSDVMPQKWRAPSFGLLIAGFSLGFAVAPTLAMVLGHFKTSLLALVLVFIGFAIAVVWYPETLSPVQAAEARMTRQVLIQGLSRNEKIWWAIRRPVYELTILNRNRLFRLLSALAFFSGLVSSGDRTLLIYYIEERLGFDDKDVALMFLIMGVLGIFVQGAFLKVLNDWIGERYIVTCCFCLGSLHNVIYGLATTKAAIFVAVAISSFGAMSFPTISAIKANNVEACEQGRIQGALYSLSALASALGPITLRFVYHYTKDGAFLGPGSMFIVAAGLYLVAVYCAYLLPEEANSKRPNVERIGSEDVFDDFERCPSSPLI
jgi:DHA1 family tetracycline resistance protein-like MFS transporter